jgi:hypothetical protein
MDRNTILAFLKLTSSSELREKLFGCFAGDRQFDKKPAPFAFDAFHFDLTAVGRDDRFDN